MAQEIYLAGRVGHAEGEIKDIASELEERGHTITCKWFENSYLPKPYLENPETSIPAAVKMNESVRKCGVFVLFASNDILGAAVELGIAIDSKHYDPRKYLYVVLPPEARQSVFYALPSVDLVVETFEPIRYEPWY